ncbi:RNA binding protein [Rhodococcus phage Jflix2]|nr:RNA binding protein [Rhodococcus phage Jflix2]
MTPEMRAVAAYIASQYTDSTVEMIVMSAPSIDPATLVDFQKITNVNSRHYRCIACGTRYSAVTNTTFCVSCLTELYVVPRS